MSACRGKQQSMMWVSLVITSIEMITLSGTELSYIDTGLMEATTYTYKIRAVDQAGNLSEASSAVKARTKMTIEVSPPLPPTKLRSARVTEHEVALM